MLQENLTSWTYVTTTDNKSRFVLGEKGRRPLICFGINSSTAHPDRLDNTVRRVRTTAIKEDFDGWIMLNVYPQRATKPEDINKEIKSDLHKQNLIEIKKIFKEYPKSKVWAAWGSLISYRPFLKECLKDINKEIKQYSQNWIHRGSLTLQGHPRHPLYLKSKEIFSSFDIHSYINNL